MTTQENLKFVKAITEFKKQYPLVTSADLQTFTIGWNKAKELETSEENNYSETNKLIADFIGISLKGGNGNSVYQHENIKYFKTTTYEEDGLCSYCHNDVNHGHNINCYKIDNEKLDFHNNYNSLMKAVDEIESMGYQVLSEPFDDNSGYFAKITANGEVINIIKCTSNHTSRIDAIYEVVVEFIEKVCTSPINYGK